MSQTKSKAPKNPCGICSIGVKYSAILCTGHCNKWFHAGCINITEKQLKKFSNEEIMSWICERCLIKRESKISNSKIEDVKEKIINTENLEDNDLETSLSLAAEAGNALLMENQELKQQIMELNRQNSGLLLELHELKNIKSSHLNYQLQVEELENQKDIMLDKHNTLIEKLCQIENQLLKEKQMRYDLEQMFIEQDRDREEIISEDKIKIKNLQNSIEHLEKDNDKLKQGQIPRLLKTTETQTNDENLNLGGINFSSSILTELTKIRRRQEHMDDSLKCLHEQLVIISTSEYKEKPTKDCQYIHQDTSEIIQEEFPGVRQTCSQKLKNTMQTTLKTSSDECTSGVRQTCNQKLKNLQTTTETARRERTPGVRQTCRQKLHSSATHQKPPHIAKLKTVQEDFNTACSKPNKTTSQFSHNSQRQKQNFKVHSTNSPRSTDGNKKRNLFSVSLQIAKSKSSSTTCALSTQLIARTEQDAIKNKQEINQEQFPTGNTFKVHKGPPCTAKNLLPGENYEDFFNKNINTISSSSSSSFLELAHRKEKNFIPNPK